MKFASVVAFLAISAVQAGENPDCKLGDFAGYYNCKRHFFVSGASSDALWCANKIDCLKVFPAPTPLPTPNPPTEAPISIAALQSFSSAGTLTTTVSTAVLLISAAFLLQ